MALELYTYMAIITEVYDGDTITAEVDLGFRISTTLKLRLARIDTPEITGLTHAEGIAARLFVRDRTLGKRVIIQTYKDKQEKYGRYLADVYLEGSALGDTGGLQACLNDLLVEQGLAVYRKY